MVTLIIRQLDDATYAALRQRAAAHGRSVEAEVHAILQHVTHRPRGNALLALHDAVVASGSGVDLELPPRTDVTRGADLS